LTQILFVQGAGEDVHDTWDNKLVESLLRELGPGYEIRYPTMPNESDPQAAAWQVPSRTKSPAFRTVRSLLATRSVEPFSSTSWPSALLQSGSEPLC